MKTIQQPSYFAITALAKNRWYWVVWPSMDWQFDWGCGHLAEGAEATKAAAVEQALNRAGIHGEWIAAKCAEHYRWLRSQQQSPLAKLATLECLYRDIYDEATGLWSSIPHRVIKRTPTFVYVDQQPFGSKQAATRQAQDRSKAFRLARAMLEQEGYAFVPLLEDELDDPLFFTTPYHVRASHATNQPADCFAVLGLSYPCSSDAVKVAYRRLARQLHPDRGGSHEKFLALQIAYQQALHLCGL